MARDLLNRFTHHVRLTHDRIHYDYQRNIAHEILDAIEKAMTGAEAVEIPVEFPRQAGKTTTVVDVVGFLLMFGRAYLGRPLRIGIFAPQREQATTDFDRLKEQLEGAHFDFKTYRSGAIKMPQKWNSKAIRLFTPHNDLAGEVYIFPITKTSKPESKTLDLIIIEEAQDVDDERMKRAVFPMGATTNAPRVYIGTSGYRVCYFKKQIENNPRAVVVKLDRVFSDRRKHAEVYEEPEHLLYERYVQQEIEEWGENSEYIRTQYFLEWIIGTGQFTTVEEMDALVGEHKLRRGIEEANVFVGIDTAKHPDRTVVTVEAHLKKWEKPRLINWLVLEGENYQDQFDIIKDFLSEYKYVRMVGIDATGQGDFMPDMFERHTSYNLHRVKFSQQSKDRMYKRLQQTIRNKEVSLPNVPDNKAYRMFRNEMLNLEKDWKGQYMKVAHPDGQGMHDDFADSWALCEDARIEWGMKRPNIRLMT